MMDRRAFITLRRIGLAVVFGISLLSVPLAAEV